MWLRLLPLTLAEWRHHPWRHGIALLAVALGVALASSVQIINESALSEFAQAVRAANGQPDVVLSARQRTGFDDALFARFALDPAVALASPVLEIDSQGRRAPGQPRVTLRIVGVDALAVAAIAPALLPRPAAEAGAAGAAGAAGTHANAGAARDDAPARVSVLDPDAAFLNAAAMQRLQLRVGDWIELQSSHAQSNTSAAQDSPWQRLRVAGSVAAGGAPLVVVDIAAAQARFGRAGRLTRLDLRLLAGIDAAAWQRTLVLPAEVTIVQPDDAVQRVSNLSRAYRVNLGVLALVALLVGAFLVYSVVSLSVAQRTPALALLGVLGLAARDRRRWLLAESLLLGLLGSALGLAGGVLLAALALRWLGADLGGGYFPGAAPVLSWPLPALAACALLGTLAAVGGAWWPARQAERLVPAMALKGLGSHSGTSAPAWPGLALLAAGAALAGLPAIGGLPLAAYAAVALLLAGGVTLVPALVGLLLGGRRGAAGPPALPSPVSPQPARWPRSPQSPLLLLALRRAWFARPTASAAVAGVVASLALSVALTVMVASFREAVSDWLDSVLPADLYARSAGSTAAADQALLPPGLVAAAAALPGVARVQAGRSRHLQIEPQQPPLTLLSRALGDDPARSLPLLGALLPAQPGELGVFVSEAAAALYGWRVGERIALPLAGSATTPALVRAIWRDYARQFGAVAIESADYQRLSGDLGVNELSLWLQPGASAAAVADALRARAGDATPLDIASTPELRRMSLAIFDRSFAVTLYLQAVAIVVGLVGVAASLSAQVLARRKEFGLLAHLGLTRRQVTAMVALETAAWLVAGTLVGSGLGLALAAVLVFVVNPQSFHWTMPLHLPLWRLAGLAGAVLAAGLLTAWLSARHAAGRQAVLAVKEDW